jgi:hypothetical protein
LIVLPPVRVSLHISPKHSHFFTYIAAVFNLGVLNVLRLPPAAHQADPDATQAFFTRQHKRSKPAFSVASTRLSFFLTKNASRLAVVSPPTLNYRREQPHIGCQLAALILGVRLAPSANA